MKSIKELAALSLIGVAAFTQVAAMPLNVASDEVTTVSYMSKLRNTTRTVDAEHGNVEATIAGIIGQNGFDPESTDYALNEVYDADNRKYGYVVEFTYNDQIGYSILKCTDAGATPMELVFGQYSPYHDEDGKYLYPSMGTYMLQQDDGSVTALSNVIDGGVKPEERNYDYNYGSVYERTIEEVSDVYKTDWSPTSQYNTCANIAGVIILNYWNKVSNNDLLNLSNFEKRPNMSEAACKFYSNKFYTLMKTNWLELDFSEFGYYEKTGGTLPKDCYDGFEELIHQKGYITRREEFRDYATMKHYLQWGIPVFIVAGDYFFTDRLYKPVISTTSGNNHLKIEYKKYFGVSYLHTFVGYGLLTYNLYNHDGSTTEICLIKVADGWGGSRYFNFYESKIISAAAIEVSKC